MLYTDFVLLLCQNEPGIDCNFDLFELEVAKFSITLSSYLLFKLL